MPRITTVLKSKKAEKASNKPVFRSGTKTADQERRQLIATAAYYRAEARGFVGGNPEQDWIAAEADIARILEKQM